jgi:sterol desaturase/sphingolipid hydroxylase (fatty acid hydroxylase superfamily)
MDFESVKDKKTSSLFPHLYLCTQKLPMLTQQEEAFIRYWEENRSRRKKVFRQFLIGIPVGLAFAIPILVNLLSGWDIRAMQETTGAFKKSQLMVLLIALLLIIGFVAIFGQKFKWDKYEQHYRELLSRRSKDPASPAPGAHSPGN